jgi:hypothetical protein
MHRSYRYKSFWPTALGLVIAALTIGSTAVPAADSQSHNRRPHVQEAWARTELYFWFGQARWNQSFGS